MDQQFLSFVTDAKSILITSHAGPDPDAVCSSLLLTEILRLNFPQNAIHVVLEEHPEIELQGIANLDSIEYRLITEALDVYKPDVLIIADANGVDRISRKYAEQIRAWLKDHDTKLVVVDHHDVGNIDNAAVFINNHGAAAVEEVYELCFTRLGMKKPDGYERTTLLGIISDTNRFQYFKPGYRRTFEIVSDLMDGGERIETVENQLHRYREPELKVIAHLAANLRHEQDYTYSFITDEFAREFMATGVAADFKHACHWFVDEFVRNTDDRVWGFIVSPDVSGADGTYSMSIRALVDTKNVLEIAQRLGGGGYIQAGGARIQAKSIAEALELIKQAIVSVN